MKERFNRSIKLLLIIYLILLVNFTLLDGAYGRDISNVLNWNANSFAEYAATSLNIVPFATIKLMVNGLISGVLDIKYFLSNLLGNLVLLMPLGYFFPKICPRLNKTFPFLAVICLVALAIEVLQLAFLTGSCDIDDFLLNVAGAMAVFPVFKKYISNEE